MQLIGGEPTIHPQFWEMLAWLHAEPRICEDLRRYQRHRARKAGDGASAWSRSATRRWCCCSSTGSRRQTNKALRQANPEKVRMRLLERLDRLDVPMQLTMTLARGVSEREIAWVVRQGVRHRNVRLVAMLPAFFSGRFEIDHDPLDRITLSDVVKGVSRRAGRPHARRAISCRFPAAIRTAAGSRCSRGASACSPTSRATWT